MPIDVRAMQIDVMAAGGQKSLMGPPGVGFLYVRDAVAAAMLPATIGPNATEDWMHWAKYDLRPREGAFRFMMGTPNIVGMVGLIASVRFLCDLGLVHIAPGLAISQMARLSARGDIPRSHPLIRLSWDQLPRSASAIPIPPIPPASKKPTNARWPLWNIWPVTMSE
jgi:hypothetical protein